MKSAGDAHTLMRGETNTAPCNRLPPDEEAFKGSDHHKSLS